MQGVQMSIPRSGVVTYLFYEDAGRMVDWYSQVFGFAELSRYVDAYGKVTNAEMLVGETELWLDGNGPEYWDRNGRGPDPWMGVWVDDLDALCARLRSEGVDIGDPVERNFGVRMTDEIVDPAGYRWSFMERVALPDPSSA
jgi:uncharacterized glyoxalase superfamily protein PhnB